MPRQRDRGRIGGKPKKHSAWVRFALFLPPFYSLEGGRTTREPEPVDV